MNRRLTIISLYDPEGFFDEYVFYLIKTLKQISKRMIIVSNSIISLDQQDIINQYTDEIIVRDNIGFDGGAFKYVITECLKNEDWSYWDQLVLSNDTYYGPLYPWEEMFKEMSLHKHDFWGITRFVANVSSDGVFFDDHVQAYFLVINNVILKDVNVFKSFWHNLEYPAKIEDAVLNYEVGLSKYFVSHGYRFSAYIDYSYPTLNISKGEIIYFDKAQQLIQYGKSPVLKRKALLWNNYANAISCMQYIDTKTNYNIKLINDNKSRLDSIGYMCFFDSKRILSFVKYHEKIYIYGNGIVAHRLDKYLKYIGVTVQNFIVTRKNDNDYDIIQIDDLKYVKNKIGVIVGTSKKYTSEIKQKLEDLGYYNGDVFLL